MDFKKHSTALIISSLLPISVTAVADTLPAGNFSGEKGNTWCANDARSGDTRSG